MFNKVLINDDHDAILASIVEVLSSFNIGSIEESKYCDEAYLKLKKAAIDGSGFDLLITDLSFKRDHRTVTIDTGEDLIAKLRMDFPELPVIVYSMKDQLQKVRQLITMYDISAYVCKDRKGALQLAEAITAVSEGERYVSQQVAKALSPKTQLEIDNFDIMLLQLLAKGLAQDEMSSHLKTNGLTPNSLSTIEKRLNKLKSQFRANNAIHLVAITKDLGVI